MLEEKKEYWKNGKLKAKWYEDENGDLEGEYKEWYENGNLKIIKNYKDGKLNGVVTLYYPNGNLKVTGKFKENYKNGLFIFYSIDKNILMNRYYELDNLVYSLKIKNQSNSKEEKDKFYINDNKDDNKTKECYLKRIYQNDMPIEEILYIDGNYEGKVEYKIEDGILKADYTYLSPNLSSCLNKWKEARKTYDIDTLDIQKYDGKVINKNRSRIRKDNGLELEI